MTSPECTDSCQNGYAVWRSRAHTTKRYPLARLQHVELLQDLTQSVWGFSRDDAIKFIGRYSEQVRHCVSVLLSSFRSLFGAMFWSLITSIRMMWPDHPLENVWCRESSFALTSTVQQMKRLVVGMEHNAGLNATHFVHAAGRHSMRSQGAR